MEAVMSTLFGGSGRLGLADQSAYEVQALIRAAGQPKIETAVVKAGPSRPPSTTRTATAAAADVEQQADAAGLQTARRRSVAGAGPGSASAQRGLPLWALTAAYGVTNLSSVVLIVVANKMVLFTHKFGFAVTLTWLHAVFTAVGMAALAGAGVFEHKTVSWRRTAPIAAVYVGFVVFNNLSIQLNPLGFYQMSKLLITPVLVAIEWFAYSKPASPRVLASVGVLLAGITLCTLTDTQVSSNPLGMLVAAGAVLVTALYQVWASTKQKELGLNGMQLLQQVSPVSAVLLAALIPLLEPVGWRGAAPGTILGYSFTPSAATWIVISSVLGLVVTLSTFLFIGATSSLTYNVVGHLKTVLIVAAGVALFGDEMGVKKLLGLAVAMAGIVWYSHIKLEEARKPAPGDSKG
ncbi:solute carrier family 35 member E3 [Raphidocelis subcapitata]|uniref:Solute carrier family 35 member E3 n=1 Tax=Raphidocelis subcapitata TaxID=307507 RepID=A0A2V0P3G8_9CHLO|nr:solute carrier family 35 member E3 [Raphidocelis subcapitata]|eukprot:GBF94129.1 solute carrier family 35 member E3 [Raphidocelis subcapitata]